MIFPSFLAVLPDPVAYIPKPLLPFTLIVPLFIIFPVSIVVYPAPIPIEYLLFVTFDAPTFIIPDVWFVAVPPLIL